MEIRPGEAGVHLVRRCSAIVLAGGRGSRLMQLTDRRAKPAVYFGGKFRIIDFALSNCLNSGIRRIGVVTQYKSHSLLRHLQRGWGFLRGELNEFVDLLPAQQRIDDEQLVPGHGRRGLPEPGHHPARHPAPTTSWCWPATTSTRWTTRSCWPTTWKAARACTVGCIEVPREEATAFGVMAVDEQRQIHAFVEKPADPPAMPGKPDRALASMGIYVFNARLPVPPAGRGRGRPGLEPRLRQGHHPARPWPKARRFAHPFSSSCIPNPPHTEPYWRDVGTVDAYWAANIDLASHRCRRSTCTTAAGRSGPTRSSCRRPSSSHDQDGQARHRRSTRLVSGGCIVSGAASRGRCCSRTCGCTRARRSTRRWCCRTSTSAGAPPEPRGDRPRLHDSRRAWSSAKTRRSMRSASIAPRTAWCS